MSKKRLSRTVIEGGRYNSNKWDRRHSNRSVRANERAFMADVMKDLDAADAISVEPRDPVYKGFRDKLGPMYRWLRSNVGRPWDDVKSEVFQKFDTRTTAGRHITYDHLLKAVEETPDFRYGRYSRYNKLEDPFTTSYYPHDYYVDEEGILREKTVISRHYKVPQFNTAQIANWLSGRVVGKVGKKLFWFVPADKSKKRGGYAKEWRTRWTYRSYYGNSFTFLYHSIRPVYRYDTEGKIVLDDNGNKVVREYQESWVAATPPSFRQDRRLNEKELAFWNTIPEFYQNKVLERSPTYPTPPKPDFSYYSYYY